MYLKYLFIILFFFICTNLYSTNYYVKNGGNDALSGTSDANAWASIAKINSFSFASGDNILFKCGSTFYGGIVVHRAGLNFSSYSTGQKPIITGLSTVSGWSNLGGNIWESSVLTNVKSTNNLVLRDEVAQQIGRFPNANAASKGYLTYTASTASSITGPALSSTTNWTGAEVAVRLFRWEVRRRTVLSHVGGVVSFSNMNAIPKVNYGYFFQRDPRTLDIDGEWYYNPSTKKLRVYASNNNPNAYTYKIATVDSLFQSSYGSLSVSNLAFYGSGMYSIYTRGGIGITITNCSINNSGGQGITSQSSSDVLIDRDTVNNSLGNGIYVYNMSTSSVSLNVTNCSVDTTALLVGMEINESVTSIGNSGLVCKGSYANIIHNSVTYSGYVGIEYQGNHISVKNNFINYFCVTRDDGGGIYTFGARAPSVVYNTDRTIKNNIVLHAVGQNYGTSDINGISARGLYQDEGTKTVFLDSNTVAYCNGSAIHGNDNDSLTFTHNVFFNNVATYSLNRFPNAKPVRNLRITGNTLYPYKFLYVNQSIDKPTLLTKQQDIAAMGVFDSNYYSLRTGLDTSLDALSTWNNNSNGNRVYATFPVLKSSFLQENHSTNVLNTGSLYYNNSDDPLIIYFVGLSKKDVFGNVHNNSDTIPAWYSKVLIPNGTAGIPPTANAGVDKTITSPTTTTSVTGSGTTGSGASITYLWSFVSGPATATFGSSTSATTTINNLTLDGTYTIQFKVTNNLSDTAVDIMQVFVNPASVVQPTANAGTDKAITLPTTSTSATATATLGSGTLVSYTWMQTAGPATATFGSANALTTTINSMTIAGTYSFQFTVLNGQGNSASDNMNVVVSPSIPPVNQPPVAVAGSNQTITLPTNTASVNGSGSSDPDGTITGWQWTTTGPNTATNSTPNSVTTTFGNLIQGAYNVRLRVTDNSGDTAVSTLTITVNAAPNNPPVANAGANQSITLPLDSVTVSGSGSTDSDGTIVSFGWIQLSGPSTATIATPSSVSTKILGLMQGDYIFQLKVIDNNGDSSVDAVLITVNAVPFEIPPTANAGTDQTIYSPLDSVILSGSGSNGSNVINCELWTKVSGPTGSVITTNNSYTTSVTNLTEGTYVFKLQVVDTAGLEGTDTVQIIVRGVGNGTRVLLRGYRIP